MKYLAFIAAALFIAITVWLLFPSVSDGPTPLNRKRSLAKNGAVQIAQSIDFYKQEYGTFPDGDIIQIIKTLSGSNQRQIVFLDSSTLSHHFHIDPWGNEFLIDLSNTNSRAHVWSMGQDCIDQQGEDGSDDIASWK